jgi:hypothetical protein
LSQHHTGFGVPVPRSLVRRGMARRPLPRQRKRAVRCSLHRTSSSILGETLNTR